MKTLCKFYGGSHLYGLNTKKSDLDERGVFMNTDPLNVFGFIKQEQQTTQNEDVDIALYELRHFLRLATKGHTTALELLYAPEDAFFEMEPSFKEVVLSNPSKFINSDNIYKSLRGYCQGEIRLALGERTGLLGGKRKEALEEYGFSPKNFSHLFRLVFCGIHFFNTGYYPVKLKNHSLQIHDLCLDIKENPGEYIKEDLHQRYLDFEHELTEAYNNSKVKIQADMDYVRKTLKYFYNAYSSVE